MQHVRRGQRDVPRDKAQRADIGRPQLAGDGDALQPERQMRRKLGQRGVGLRPSGGRIDDEAYAMAALGLAAGDVDHMTEQSAERRAQDVHDLQRPRRRGFDNAERFGVHRGIGRNGGGGFHRCGSPPVAHGEILKSRGRPLRGLSRAAVKKALRARK